MLDRLIADTRARAGRVFPVRQALGPRAAGARLDGVDEVFDPGSGLNRVFRAADLVISTAGYNSVLELATTDTPALLMPIPRSLDDQAARARLWGPRLGHGYEPTAHGQAVHWLAGQIACPCRRAPVDLGTDGAARAAELILERT
ncbi:MAG: glycosyltransferase [Paracoccaceae bacterium]